MPTTTDIRLPEWVQEQLYIAHDALQDEVGRPLTPRAINDGYCRAFARHVCDRDRTCRIAPRSHGLTHTWLTITLDTSTSSQTVHFDAERMRWGTTDPRQLPLFQHPDVSFEPDAVAHGFP